MFKKSHEPQPDQARDEGPGRVPRRTPTTVPIELLRLQRLAGNRAVATALTVQRDAPGDLAEGDAAVQESTGYQGAVLKSLEPYRGKINQLLVSGDVYYESAAERMAAGYAAWGKNYYNKTQAYLYEAQKATEFTKEGQRGKGTGSNHMAYLGVNTDKESDVSYQSEIFDVDKGGYVSNRRTQATSMEIKASTSPTFEAVDQLTREGLQQLKKRQDTLQFQELRLEVHIDNKDNHWPATDHMFQNEYGGSMATFGSSANVKVRATKYLTGMKATYGINLPLRVTLQYRHYGPLVVDV